MLVTGVRIFTTQLFTNNNIKVLIQINAFLRDQSDLYVNYIRNNVSEPVTFFTGSRLHILLKKVYRLRLYKYYLAHSFNNIFFYK